MSTSLLAHSIKVAIESSATQARATGLRGRIAFVVLRSMTAALPLPLPLHHTVRFYTLNRSLVSQAGYTWTSSLD